MPDGAERRRALGVWTAAAAGGGASGWLLGGVITEQAGWPWVFLVNVPIGAAAVALAPLLVPETRAGGGGRRLDVAGAATLTTGLALVVLGLTRAQIDGVRSPLAAGGVAAGALLLALFARIETRAADPLLPASLLRADGLAGRRTWPPLRSRRPRPRRCCSACSRCRTATATSALATGALFAPFNVAVICGSLSARAPCAPSARGLR